MTQSQISSPHARGAFRRISPKVGWLVPWLFLGANAWAFYRYGLPAVLGVFAAVFAVAGMALLLHAWRARRRAIQSLSWMPVTARIRRSEVVRKIRPCSSSISGQTDYMTYWHPEIEYEYEFHGRRYVSDRALLVRVNFPEQKARELVAGYPPGTLVQAWCDPRRPAMAILKPGMAGYESQYRMPFFIAGGFLLLGLILLAAVYAVGR